MSDMFKTLSVMRGSNRYNAWLYSSIKDHLQGVVLDIGSGLGEIARHFKEQCIEEVILSDRDPLMLNALGTARFPLKKYRVLALDIADPKAVNGHPGGIADTVTCINVLEHIPQDIIALKHMKHFLKKGGKIVLFVPALPVIYGSLDRLVDHHRRYTKRTLGEIIEKAGFIIKEGYYMNMFGIMTWFLAGQVLRQKEFHKEACHMLDKIVPSLRTLESLGSPPLGQSLIMVGECA